MFSMKLRSGRAFGRKTYLIHPEERLHFLPALIIRCGHCATADRFDCSDLPIIVSKRRFVWVLFA